MHHKHQEIEKKTIEINRLKKEIATLKETIPLHIGIYIVFVALFIFFLDKYLYPYFGGSINFIIASILIFSVIGIALLYIKWRKIYSISKNLENLQEQLYILMKLEQTDD